MLKRMVSTTILCAMLSLTVQEAFSQTGDTETIAGEQQRFATNVFGIGLYGSLTTGMGVSFKHHAPKIPFAYQLNGGIIKLGETLLYSIGGELHYDLIVGDRDRLFATVGFGTYYVGDTTNELSTPTRLGAGLGYELPLSRVINLTLSVLVTGFLPGGSIFPLPSAGIHIYFK